MTDRPAPVVPGLTGLTVLARGGYATVYAAVQESVGRDVAVKVENRPLETERDQRRFLREARAAGRMSSHPHVVDLFDAGVTGDGHPYLIMERCDGSYAERMRTSPLSPIEARDLGVKIADALSDAHSLGVLHRDVKPANILYSGFGEPALADFGLAVLSEARDTSITFEVLTPAYAPPEMFRQVMPAPAADVYALAATLYAVMRGRPPRWPDDGSPSLVSVMDMFHQPVPRLPGVPTSFLDLLRTAMANDEASRPTALEMRDALAALRIQAPPTTQPPKRATSVAPLPPGSDDVTVAQPPVARARRRRWWPMGAAAFALVTLLSLFMGYASGALQPVSATTPTHHPSAAHPGGPCGPLLPSGAQCPSQPECYGQMTDRGTADRVDCAGRHTWEVFGVADVPADLVGSDPKALRESAAVRQVCAQLGLVTLVPLEDIQSWHVEVLPPSSGERTYRCLAGKGPDALTSPQLGRSS